MTAKIIRALPNAPAPTKAFRNKWEGDNPEPVQKINPYALTGRDNRRNKEKKKEPKEKKPRKVYKGHRWTDEETMTLICLYNRGKTRREISEELGIEYRIVDNKLHNLMQRLIISKRSK